MNVKAPTHLVKAAATAALAAACVLAAAPAHAAKPVSSATPLQAAAGGHARTVVPFHPFTGDQRRALLSMARSTWRFFGDDVDPRTHLPMDNVTYAGGSASPTGHGRYTSAANIGVYLWAIVAAQDLGLINRGQATARARATLDEVERLPRSHGFLYQWYSTSTGKVLTNPGQLACSVTTGTFDNCSFLSNVDNGWFASGLVEVRQALPGARVLASSLLGQMDFSIFYDNRPETHCNVNPAVPGDQPTGQMFGGYYVGSPPEIGQNWTRYYHNGALYSDPRISAYIGLGLNQMPGNVWWRSWRELPPKAPFSDCIADPDFSWQGQWPMKGHWEQIKDPRSGRIFPVWEGYYTYPGTDLRFIPTYSGGMFEALMPAQIVPETSWGKGSFGLADRRTVQVQRRYALGQLHLPVWGMSPSSTPDDSGGYGSYGVEGLKLPYHGAGATAADPNEGLSQCHGCATEDVITPHASFIALDADPQQAYQNILNLRKDYPGLYGTHGFFDSVDPTTGSVGHRILVLDDSMILAALDNALDDRAMQRHFAADPVSSAAYTYLQAEQFPLGRH